MEILASLEAQVSFRMEDWWALSRNRLNAKDPKASTWRSLPPCKDQDQLQRIARRFRERLNLRLQFLNFRWELSQKAQRAPTSAWIMQSDHLLLSLMKKNQRLTTWLKRTLKTTIAQCEGVQIKAAKARITAPPTRGARTASPSKANWMPISLSTQHDNRKTSAKRPMKSCALSTAK